MPKEHALTLPRLTHATAAALTLILVGCEKGTTTQGQQRSDSHSGESSSLAPTNRVDIPPAVRQNLGVTFARVEYRNVARTLRVPGHFELLPTARREHLTPLAGRVELLVDQYERVEPGTALYRVDSPAWRDLHERIAATQAKVDSMQPLRDAHRRHEQSLAEKRELWQDRLAQLETLRSAGGGNAAQFTEARDTLNTTEAELAETMEKDAELQAIEKQSQADLRALQSRLDMLVRSGSCSDTHNAVSPDPGYTVCAIAPGVVESIGVTTGGLAEENALVLSLVQPERVRFRARALQSDLGHLRDGLPAAITPTQGGSIPMGDVMSGPLQLGLAASPDDRTIDLLVEPQTVRPWARAGVAAHLEITLAGGSEELAIPLAAIARDGATPIIFRRDPADPDKAVRIEADLGVSDGRWVVISSGVKQGDEIVVGGNYQLMLATSGSTSKAGHFHPDGTFHEGDH